MKKLILILCLITTPSFASELVCKQVSPERATNSFIIRCSNEEVVCYVYDSANMQSGSMSCKFKK